MIPPKTFSFMIESMTIHSGLGFEWVNAGRPRNCQLYSDFCKAEKHYNNYMNQFWNKFSEKQSEEWSRTHELIVLNRERNKL